MGLGEVVLIVVCVTLGSLLFSAMTLLCALNYSEQIKRLKMQVQDLKESDKPIEKLKQEIGEYKAEFERKNKFMAALIVDVQSRDEEIEKLTQQLKQRYAAVKAPSKKKRK
ncbi:MULTISPECIES: hypothetical protein [Bartonella]|uniref:hypothetical protein n=1 Tax=Bartonella TaxID=773 RepID=UPI001ABB8709|nr:MULTISPECIES: hypothetical protein [Bartonella]